MNAAPITNFFNTLNRKLEPPVKQHLKHVYGCMSLALLAASVGSYIHIFTGYLSGGLLSSLLGIGICFYLMSTPDNEKNRGTRLALYLGFAFLMGLSVGPLLELTLYINPKILLTAIGSTSIIFACFTLATIFSEHRKWLYLGGFLSSTLSLLLFTSLINLFIGSKIIMLTHLYIGLFLMCGFVIYDTALIIEKRRLGETDYIWHSLILFMDFLNLFKHILILLLQKEEGKQRKKK